MVLGARSSSAINPESSWGGIFTRLSWCLKALTSVEFSFFAMLIPVFLLVIARERSDRGNLPLLLPFHLFQMTYYLLLTKYYKNAILMLGGCPTTSCAHRWLKCHRPPSKSLPYQTNSGRVFYIIWKKLNSIAQKSSFFTIIPWQLPCEKRVFWL